MQRLQTTDLDAEQRAICRMPLPLPKCNADACKSGRVPCPCPQDCLMSDDESTRWERLQAAVLRALEPAFVRLLGVLEMFTAPVFWPFYWALVVVALCAALVIVGSLQ